MDRRKFIAGGCAVPLVAGAGLAVAEAPAVDFKQSDEYWELQWLIGEYEEELAEMRTHAQIMRKLHTNRVVENP